MIELSEVSKTYGRPARVGRGPQTAALRDVSLSLAPGGIIGVVGPNGAGKTTLFGLLLGFLEATSGELSIGDLDPRSYVRRHGASYLPERFQLPGAWTVRSALDALLRLGNAEADVDAVLSDWQLTEFADAPAATLSRGTLQRLGIAQALAAPRALVVLDEPTEGLDPVWRVRFRERLAALRAPDRVVLLASHDLAEVERVADRAVVLRDGAVHEIVELRGRADSAEPRAFVLQLAAEHESVAQLFPDARADGATYHITAADTADLNARLAAVIAAGALVLSLGRADSLEDRVTRGTENG